MAAAAKVAGAAHGHLKIKLGAGGDDLARLRAIRDAVPDARLIADVNEAWTIDMLVASLPELAALGIEMLEQPLPAGQDAALAEIDRKSTRLNSSHQCASRLPSSACKKNTT